MNEEQILRQMNFSKEFIDYYQRESKLDSYDEIPEVMVLETDEENIVSSSSFIYSSLYNQ